MLVLNLTPSFCTLKMTVVPTFSSMNPMRCIVLCIVFSPCCIASKVFFEGGGGAVELSERQNIELQEASSI